MKKNVSVMFLVFLFGVAPILPAFNTAGTLGGWGKTYDGWVLWPVEPRGLPPPAGEHLTISDKLFMREILQRNTRIHIGDG